MHYDSQRIFPSRSTVAFNEILDMLILCFFKTMNEGILYYCRFYTLTGRSFRRIHFVENHSVLRNDHPLDLVRLYNPDCHNMHSLIVSKSNLLERRFAYSEMLVVLKG